MSRYIKLTGKSTGKPIMVPVERIMSIAESEESTEVFVDGMSQVYTILPWHVKETAKEIMDLLEPPCIAHHMNGGMVCIKCGATLSQILGNISVQ